MPNIDTQVLEAEIAKAFDGATPQEEVKEVETKPTEQPEEVKPEVKTEEVKEESEGFTKVNPNELPEELKPIYKSLLADYTRKRQAESAEAKALRQELEQLRSTLQQGTEEPQEQVEMDNTNLTTDDIKRLVREEREQEWEQQALLDIPLIDSRLDENNPIEYNKRFDDAVRAQLDEALAEHVEKTGTKLGFDYKSVVKEIIEEEEKQLESLFKQWTKRQSALAKENASKFKKQAPSSSTGKTVNTNKSLSLDEAIGAAFEPQ